MQASEHTMPLKTAKNDAFSLKKSGFKITFGEFLGTYDLHFSCLSIFYQLWTHIGHFKAKKLKLNFHPISAPSSPPGRFLNATTTPWKWFLGVPWWNTFQWDPREPPKPFSEKNYFRPEIPNPLSQPSVTPHCRDGSSLRPNMLVNFCSLP